MPIHSPTFLPSSPETDSYAKLPLEDGWVFPTVPDEYHTFRPCTELHSTRVSHRLLPSTSVLNHLSVHIPTVPGDNTRPESSQSTVQARDPVPATTLTQLSLSSQTSQCVSSCLLCLLCNTKSITSRSDILLLDESDLILGCVNVLLFLLFGRELPVWSSSIAAWHFR